MPIYEYKCKECEKQFTKLVFKADAEVECPACKSKQVEKQISTLGSIGGSSSSSGGCGCSGGGTKSGFG